VSHPHHTNQYTRTRYLKMLSWLASFFRQSHNGDSSSSQREPKSLSNGGFVPHANLHSLHPGELVLNRATVKMVQEMLDKNQLPRTLHKRINVLMKRRPQKVSNRELTRVTSQMSQKRGIACPKKKKGKAVNKGKCAAKKNSPCAAQASQSH